jgi:hypothetical protein
MITVLFVKIALFLSPTGYFNKLVYKLNSFEKPEMGEIAS